MEIHGGFIRKVPTKGKLFFFLIFLISVYDLMKLVIFWITINSR